MVAEFEILGVGVRLAPARVGASVAPSALCAENRELCFAFLRQQWENFALKMENFAPILG